MGRSGKNSRRQRNTSFTIPYSKKLLCAKFILIILMLPKTPELGSPSPNFRIAPVGGRLTRFKFSVHQAYKPGGIGFRAWSPPGPRLSANH
ncbi:hypothetical protein AVEN_184408-1 [Araneus ventricosus]|uniref:Uncharacterized protein n=1 Tax=Araneus ventricosus TaxID=182803 RepID=A0A4Y2BG51_ARAVE|nr:hypothetical protein AVEN_184408-1 [Araneus ventricosus]